MLVWIVLLCVTMLYIYTLADRFFPCRSPLRSWVVFRGTWSVDSRPCIVVVAPTELYVRSIVYLVLTFGCVASKKETSIVGLGDMLVPS